jgi:alanine dehydrogenase
MTELLVLDRARVAELLEVEPLFEALEQAFRTFSAGGSSVPPRVAASTPKGLLGAMPGYLEGVGLASKLVSVFPENEGGDRPSHQGLIVLFDEENGTPLAVMDGIRITALRTAASAAVAARLLARDDAAVLAVLGAGVQGHAHLETVPRVRRFAEIRIASRTADHARALGARAPDLVAGADGGEPVIRVCESFEDAVRGADVVCCCTDAREPVVEFGWLSPGTHIGSVGGAFGRELDGATIDGGKLFVEWRGAVTSAPPAGAGELQGVDPDRVAELGEVLAGLRQGRESRDEITVYKSTGHAIEDIAAARLVYDRALRHGEGRSVPI